MFEPERLRLVIVFYHARLLALEIYPRWAIIFDCFFEVCRDLCAVGSCGVLAFQDWLELVHGGRVKGEVLSKMKGNEGLFSVDDDRYEVQSQ